MKGADQFTSFWVFCSTASGALCAEHATVGSRPAKERFKRILDIE